MKRCLLICMTIVVTCGMRGSGPAIATRMLATVSKELRLCGARILLDANPEYDVDLAEIERVLEENGFPCPYVLDITIWSQADLDWALFKLNRAGLGLYAIFSNGHHMIAVYVLNDLHLEETPGHDFSTLNSLLEKEWGNWIILHELGHMIWNGKGWGHSSETEFWCDHFADENYGRYAIVIEEGGK